MASEQMNDLNRTKSTLPCDYTPREEFFHVLSHIPGIVIGILMLGYSLCRAPQLPGKVSGSIFGACLVILYLASCAYHSVPPSDFNRKKFLQVLDHCMIFVLIAGSAMPFVSVMGVRAPGTALFVTVWIWGLAALGCLLLAMDFQRFQKPSLLIYLAMGFSVLLGVKPLYAGLGLTGLLLLLSGGAAYCAGLLLYRTKRPWTHAAFHVLCILGSAIHCTCVGLTIL